eukprot:6180973-Pleurochrysis_carterae.AAC.5
MEPGHDLADSVTIEAHRLEGEGLHGSVRYAPAGASHDYEPAVRSILKKPAANRASGARSVVLTAGDDSTLSSLAVDSDQGTRPVDGSGLKRRVKTLNIFRAFPKDRKGVPGRTSTSDAHQPAEAATPASASYLSCILSGCAALAPLHSTPMPSEWRRCCSEVACNSYHPPVHALRHGARMPAMRSWSRCPARLEI